MVVLVGCDDLEGVLGIGPPTAALKGVALIESPTAEQWLGFGCAETLGAGACAVVGLESPPRDALGFSFELVFDVNNPNALPIPLVETLLGFSAFDEDNIGSVCVSFCDPADADCAPDVAPVDACTATADEDLIPTVDDLLVFAADVSAGGIDNGDWRVIAPFSTTETHLRFDLAVDPMLRIADDLLGQALDDVFSGRSPTFEVPYTVEGTLFFDVPSFGRHAVGFGPLADEWQLR